MVQNPEVVGNALKTLSLRITKTSTELEAMGEDASYAYESTADYRKEVLAITGAYGKQIDLLDETTGAYKSTYQILKELSAVWDDIDDAGKQSLLYTLGGARQVNVLSAILKNFDDAEKVVEELSNAQGSALAENEQHLDSIMGKWSQLQASFQELSSTTIDSELVKFMLDFANATLKAADNLMELTGLFPLLISGATSYIRATEGKDFLLYNGAFSLGNLMKPLDSREDQSSQQIGNIWGHLNIQKNRYINDAAELKKLLPVLETFHSGATNSLERSEKFMAKIVDHSTTMSETTQGILATRLKLANTDKEAVNILSESVDQLDNAATKSKSFGQILGGALKGIAVAAAISLAIKGISMAVDAAITTVEEHQEKIKEYSDKISEASDELEKLQDLQANGVGITSNDKARMDYLKEYVDLLELAKENELREVVEKDLVAPDSNPFKKNSYETAHSVYGGGWKVNESGDVYYDSGNIPRYVATLEGQITRATSEGISLEEFEQAQNAASHAYSQVFDDMTIIQGYKSELEKALPLYEEGTVYHRQLSEEIEWANNALENYQSTLKKANASGVIPGNYQYGTPSTEYNKRDTWNIFDNYDSKTVTDIVDGEDIVKNIKLDIEGSDKAENLQQILKDVQETSFDQLNKEVDDMQSAFSTLVTASQEYEKTGAYTIDTLQALTQIDGRYLDMLIDEEGQINLNEEAMRKLAIARIEEMRIKILQTAITNIEALTNEAAATKVVEEAKLDEASALRENTEELLENTAAQMLALGVSQGFGRVQEEAIDIIINRANAMIKAIDITNLFGDSTSEAKDAIDDLNDALRDQGNLILKALDNRKKPLEDEIEAIDDKKESLQDELDALNEIYEAEDKEFELQKRKDAYERAKANKTVRLYTHDKGWQWVADPTEIKEAEDAYNEYLKEMERDDAKKAIEDQIDALDKAKEAIQDEIEAIDDLKDKVNDAMDNIGKTYEEHQAELALMAEFENLTYDQLEARVNDYANNVIKSYNAAAEAAANYNKVVTENLTSSAKVSSVDIAKNTPSDAYIKYKNKQIEDTNTFSSFYYKSSAEAAASHARYHTGGFVKGISSTANVSPAFRQYMSNLEHNEVPAILEAGEFVLTKNHQKAILDNNTALVNSSSSARNISLEIGDIIVQNPVGNVETLSTAIIRQLPNQILKDLYNK